VAARDFVEALVGAADEAEEARRLESLQRANPEPRI